ncbi:hypothetical protein ACK9YZ_22870 [Rhizobium sp. ZK1]|uniref:hypothetical protein n=1 Tax=Rhizobium sp. ZK1 TaxID=3389872 RepID=UPI0039F70886
MINTVFQLLGEQLLAARKKRDLSQPALAERLAEIVHAYRNWNVTLPTIAWAGTA